MKLFELCGADREIRFSPYTWRIRMALAHKGLAYEGVPCRFLEKEKFAPSGSKTVPVLEDDGRWINESFRIAEYLEDQYPDAPSLFGGGEARGEARFINAWADRAQIVPLFFAIISDIPAHLSEEDRVYFLESREKRLGKPVPAFREEREAHLATLHQNLAPLKATLRAQPFICGEAPAYGDYIVFGGFQWARLVSPIDALEGQEVLAEWRARMMVLFDGMAAKAKSAI